MQSNIDYKIRKHESKLALYRNMQGGGGRIR